MESVPVSVMERTQERSSQGGDCAPFKGEKEYFLLLYFLPHIKDLHILGTGHPSFSLLCRIVVVFHFSLSTSQDSCVCVGVNLSVISQAGFGQTLEIIVIFLLTL